MKKILHLFPTYKTGGGPLRILENIENSSDTYRHYTAAKCEDKALFAAFQKASCQCFDVDLTTFSLRALLHLLKIIKTIQPEIIHAHGKGGALYAFFIQVLSLKKYKVFRTFHGFNFKKYTWLKRRLYLGFEYLSNTMIQYSIAVSPSERQYYLDTTKGTPKKVLVIPNGVSVTQSPPPQALKKVTDKYKINILTLSRISHEKDLITMLKAFEKLDTKNIALHIMGGYMESDLGYKSKVDTFYKTLKCKERVFFWGDIPNASAYMHHFDLYWTTALFEGLPGAVIEAMMSKVFIVGTNCRGNIDLIENKVTGFLTQMKNAEDNYQKIKQALAIIGTTEHKNIIENAYEKSKEFSMENHIKRIKELYG